MGTVRAIGRLILLTGVTGVLYLVLVLGRLIVLLSSSATTWWSNRILRIWARIAARIIGMDVRVEGVPPKCPFFLVANHLSYVDVLLFLTQAPGVFIAKQEVGRWPGIGWLARSINTLFLDRRNYRDLPRVNRLISRVLDRGQGIILFPEGTTSGGHDVRVFNPSLLELPASRGMGVQFAAICYRVPAADDDGAAAICWWDDTPFVRHAFNVLKIPHFEARVTFGPHPVSADDRKVLAQRLRQEVSQSLATLRRQATADGDASGTG